MYIGGGQPWDSVSLLCGITDSQNGTDKSAMPIKNQIHILDRHEICCQNKFVAWLISHLIITYRYELTSICKHLL